MRLLLLAASLLPASLGKAIKGCVPKAPSPTVIHIPKTGGAYQRAAAVASVYAVHRRHDGDVLFSLLYQ
jgi:hypothetical protein